MKRIEQLQPLSKEHHLSLTLGHKAIQVSASGDNKAITDLCQKIVNEYPLVWRVHFNIEEESIFRLFENKQNEIAQLCEKLKQEHQTMDAYFEQMKSGDYSILSNFGSLLKEHTRTEERQLFPLLGDALKAQELEYIYLLSYKR